MASMQDDGRQPLGSLLRELADSGATLVRQETRLAKLELGEAGSALARGTVMTAMGGVLMFLGALALLTGVILLGGDQWLRDNYWLAGLIITLLTGGLALVLAKRGAGLLSPSRLAPDQTIETLQEDKEWLRQQLKSGATSR
jgi:uncharacterized membrane protein YqjE